MKVTAASTGVKKARLERQKREAKRVVKTRTEDLSTKVPVYIPELRAVVYAKPGADKEQVKRKYLTQHNHELKTAGKL